MQQRKTRNLSWRKSSVNVLKCFGPWPTLIYGRSWCLRERCAVSVEGQFYEKVTKVQQVWGGTLKARGVWIQQGHHLTSENGFTYPRYPPLLSSLLHSRKTITRIFCKRSLSGCLNLNPQSTTNWSYGFGPDIIFPLITVFPLVRQD